jgi:hypothetical protein
MNILFTVQHPANVHLFKHAADRLDAAGHEVLTLARRKEVTVELLEKYDLDHRVLCDAHDGSVVDIARTQLAYEFRVLRAAYRFDPDVVVTSGGLAGAHASRLVGAASLTFLDTETHVAGHNRLVTPFTDRVYTPRWLTSDCGPNQVRYDGLHELAYLHPNQFTPDPDLLTERGVDPDDRFFVVRFGAYDAIHDVGKSGFSRAGMSELVDRLDAEGTVYITDEDGLPPEFRSYDLPVDPHEIHHLLAYADGFVGEVATMTIEAAVLGTPTVRMSPFAGGNDMGKFRELDRRGLVRSFSDSHEAAALEAVSEIASDETAPAEWESRRREFLDDTVDVTEFIVSRTLAAGGA